MKAAALPFLLLLAACAASGPTDGPQGPQGPTSGASAFRQTVSSSALSAEPTPLPQTSPLADLVGWYRMPAGDTALVTWAAAEGLRIFSLMDTLYTGRIVVGPEGELRWGTEEGPEIEVRGAAGTISGFEWSPAGAGEGAARVATRLPSYGYTVERFDVVTPDARLAGSLFLPRESAPFPGAVMIHGSGESDRDNAWYMMVADALARAGIAVLLPDKRGSGRSGGDWFTTGLAGFATDARAEMEALRNHPSIDPARVGFVGLSQGGRIAPMAANGSRPAFVVNLSGAAVPLNAQLDHEVRNDLDDDWIPGFLDFAVHPVSIWTIKRRRPAWWDMNGPIDPLEHWSRLDAPALVVYGAEDEHDNVPVAESVTALRSLEKPNLEVSVFENTGHALAEEGSSRIRSDIMERVVDWILEAVEDEVGGR